MSALTLGVLITYYGERELLRDCLESLARQTQPVDEIVIYDDASPTLPDPYIPAGLAVRILHGEVNRGPARGRNALLAGSRSRYVHFHDADDLFAPDWHARVRDSLESRGVDAVFTEIDAIREGEPDSQRVLGLDKLITAGDLLRFCIQAVMLVPSGTYRRELVESIGGYRVSLWQSEDFDFHVRLAAQQPSYAIIPDALVTIRVRTASRSRNQVQVWSNFVEAIALLAGEVPAEYRADLADAAARAGSRLYALRAGRQANSAFRLATTLGPPRFTTHRRAYRLLAATVGYGPAERLASVYRQLLPARVRQLFA